MHTHTSAPPLAPMTNLRIKLRIVLTAYVPDADLTLLAAGLGIALSGESKAERVRALIITADHTGRLDDLVQRLWERMDNGEWIMQNYSQQRKVRFILNSPLSTLHSFRPLLLPADIAHRQYEGQAAVPGDPAGIAALGQGP